MYDGKDSPSSEKKKKTKSCGKKLIKPDTSPYNSLQELSTAIISFRFKVPRQRCLNCSNSQYKLQILARLQRNNSPAKSLVPLLKFLCNAIVIAFADLSSGPQHITTNTTTNLIAKRAIPQPTSKQNKN